jgi:hypothetical protein
MKTVLKPYLRSLPLVFLVSLAIAGFSAPNIAATGHNAHGDHDAAHAPAASEAPNVDGLMKKSDKPAGEVTPPQVAQPNSKSNAHSSVSATSDGHAHKHTDVK